ncbi:MAG: hypothetical protein HZB63_07830, partial [Deltaproteobacteria bacterium]|nr:hypothetical protein [Deltaproteobacteria bacterium]
MSVRLQGSFLSACLLALVLSACSSTNDGTIAVRLQYPQEGSLSAPSGRAAGDAPRPLYSKLPGNRILIRVLAPHIATPMEAWFDRSAGRGEIAGIPPGTRI